MPQFGGETEKFRKLDRDHLIAELNWIVARRSEFRHHPWFAKRSAFAAIGGAIHTDP